MIAGAQRGRAGLGAHPHPPPRRVPVQALFCAPPMGLRLHIHQGQHNLDGGAVDDRTREVVHIVLISQVAADQYGLRRFCPRLTVTKEPAQYDLSE